MQRDEDGLWTIYPLGGRGGVAVNGKKVNYQRAITVGDKVTVGGIDLYFFPASAEERGSRPSAVSAPAAAFGPRRRWPISQRFKGFCSWSWYTPKARNSPLCSWGASVYCARPCGGCTPCTVCSGAPGFELESLAFFLTSLCLCITASSSISTLPKQTVSVLLGLFAFVLLGLFLRDLAIAKKLRWPVAIAACALAGL